jgi:hypothetical protein
MADNPSAATDFCNKIGTKRTRRSITYDSRNACPLLR